MPTAMSAVAGEKRGFEFRRDRLILRPMETDSTFTAGSLTWERVR